MASKATRPEAIFLIALAIVPPTVWLTVKPPAGRAVPAGAVEDPDAGLAVVPQAGWQAERTISSTSEKTDILTVTKREDGRVLGQITLSFTDATLPRDGRSTLKIQEFVKRGFAGRLDTFGLDEPRVDQVDHLKAIKLRGRGATDRKVVLLQAGQRVEQFEKSSVHFLYWLVQGPGRTLLLLATAEEQDFDALEVEMRETLASVRVTRRPWGLSHLAELATGRLRAELIGALLGAFFALYRLIFSSVLSE